MNDRMLEAGVAVLKKRGYLKGETTAADLEAVSEVYEEMRKAVGIPPLPPGFEEQQW